MEFVACQGFSTAQDQAVGLDGRLAIAQAQLAPPGSEGQDVGHWLPCTGGILQGLAKQHQASAFGDQWQPPGGRACQVPKASMGLSQLVSVQFWITTGHHDGPAGSGQGLVCQGTPSNRVQPDRQ